MKINICENTFRDDELVDDFCKELINEDDDYDDYF